MNRMQGRPGYISKKYLEFLDAHAQAWERGTHPVPYLLGEFPELTEKQAEGIVNWWGNGNSPAGKGAGESPERKGRY